MKKEIKTKQKSKKTEQKARWYDNDLPSLIEEDLQASLHHDARKWALEFSNPEHIGEHTWNESRGLLIQNTGNYRVRCILAIDCVDARIGLSMYKTTFNAIGVELELGEYTIVAPDRRSQQDSSKAAKVVDVPGMEVV